MSLQFGAEIGQGGGWLNITDGRLFQRMDTATWNERRPSV